VDEPAAGDPGATTPPPDESVDAAAPSPWARPEAQAAPWALPDAPAEGASSPGAAAFSGTTHTTPVEPVVGPPAPLLGALRPMTVGDTLDGAFALFRSRPRAVLGIAALFIVPLQFLGAYLQRNAFGAGDFSEAFSDPSVGFANANTGMSTTSSLGPFVVLILMGLVLSFICGTYAQMLAAWYGGSDISTRAAITKTLRQAWPLIAGWFLVHLVAVPASCTGIGGYLIAPFYLVLAPAIAIERVGPIDGIKRAWFVGTKRYGVALLVALGSGVVATLLSYALSTLPTAVAVLLGDDLGWLLVAVGNSLAGILAAVAVAGATSLFYFDSRVRLEGLDLVLTAADVFPRDR
jgi:hypothetical protein